MRCTLEPAIQSDDTVSEYPFRQLSINYNMDVNKGLHYQVNHRLYMPWTPSL